MREKKKTGLSVRGILGLVFAPMGLAFVVTGAVMYLAGAGDSAEESRTFLWVFSLVGLPFLVSGAVLCILEYLRRRRLQALYEGGNYVMARIASAERVANVSYHNGIRPCVAECHYTDPDTGTVHIWYSRYLSFDPTDVFTSREVPVYVDRSDMREGFVDIDAVLPDVRIHR